MKPIHFFFLIRHTWEPQSLILLCSFSITTNSRVTRAFGVLSVGTGCLIRTKLCWHLILFVCLFVVGSKPEQLTMSRWGVQQTWCQEKCGLTTTERQRGICNLHEMYEICCRGGQVGGVSSPVPAQHQWPTKKQNPKVAVHHSTPRLLNSAWSDLASLPSGAPQHFLHLSV